MLFFESYKNIFWAVKATEVLEVAAFKIGNPLVVYGVHTRPLSVDLKIETLESKNPMVAI